MIRIGIIEDEIVYRQVLDRLFKQQPEFSLQIVADSVEDFFKKWDKHLHFDVILSDIVLPGESGIDGIKRIKKRAPRVEVIMLTSSDDPDNIFQSLCAGATGYLLKTSPLDEVKQSIKNLLEGGSPMSPAIARKVIEHFNPRPTEYLANGLTQRETQIVQAIQSGLTNKEVAIRLDIGLETVKTHIKNIFQKLEVTSRHEIIKGNFIK